MKVVLRRIGYGTSCNLVVTNVVLAHAYPLVEGIVVTPLSRAWSPSSSLFLLHGLRLLLVGDCGPFLRVVVGCRVLVSTHNVDVVNLAGVLDLVGVEHDHATLRLL